jgi:hypothetical protein
LSTPITVLRIAQPAAEDEQRAERADQRNSKELPRTRGAGAIRACQGDDTRPL